MYSIKQISRKIQKGKEMEQIADELEESLEKVKQVCETISECGPDVDVMTIYEKLQNKIEQL